MRHRRDNIRLGRKNTHRQATLAALARALLVKESIRTTKVRAKEAQPLIDKLINIAKDNTPESKRRAFALIRDKALIEPLFGDIASRFKTRASGYTRVIPLYPRKGDCASMAILELVEKKIKTAPKKARPGKEPLKEEGIKKTGETKKEPEKALKTKAEPPKAATPPQEEKKEHKMMIPESKTAIKEAIRTKRAKEEQKKVKDMGFFKNLRRYFRGKAA